MSKTFGLFVRLLICLLVIGQAQFSIAVANPLQDHAQEVDHHDADHDHDEQEGHSLANDDHGHHSSGNSCQSHHDDHSEFNPGETAFHHISDQNVYNIGWSQIPLPCMLYVPGEGLDVFSSGKFHADYHGNGTNAYDGYVLYGGQVRRIMDSSFPDGLVDIGEHAVFSEKEEVDGKAGSRGVGEKWKHLLVTLC